MDLRDQIKQELTKRKKDRGFGDTFERFTTFTGIKRLVKWWYGDKDCGCDRRKDYLNQLSNPKPTPPPTPNVPLDKK